MSDSICRTDARTHPKSKNWAVYAWNYAYLVWAISERYPSLHDALKHKRPADEIVDLSVLPVPKDSPFFIIERDLEEMGTKTLRWAFVWNLSATIYLHRVSNTDERMIICAAAIAHYEHIANTAMLEKEKESARYCIWHWLEVYEKALLDQSSATQARYDARLKTINKIERVVRRAYRNGSMTPTQRARLYFLALARKYNWTKDCFARFGRFDGTLLKNHEEKINFEQDKIARNMPLDLFCHRYEPDR